MKIVCFFNNKGGKRVLVIDGDPQCNATQLILGDDNVVDLYWPEAGNLPKHKTLLDVVTPIQDGDSSVDTSVSLIGPKDNRFGVSLLPGHPKFSMTEDKLSQAWQEARSGDIGGFRKMGWCRTLCNTWASEFDFVFIDIGPSLGPINRTFLLACDYFVTPLGADVFSLIAVRNIQDWLDAWIGLYENGITLCEQAAPGKLAFHKVQTNLPIKHGYAGYTLQRYIAKSKEGVRRPTVAFEKVIKLVPAQIESSLGRYLPYGTHFDQAKLGDVPNMYSLIPLAQLVNAPLLSLGSSDGMVGSQYKQASDYAEIFRLFASRLALNIGERLPLNVGTSK